MPETIDVTKIKPNPRQPRRRFDEEGLQELADSIGAHGVLNPVLVRPAGDGYELVHGERRWRAARLAGLAQIPAEVRDLSDEEVFEIALAENLQREDLTPVEEAEAFAHYLSDGMTQTALAQKIAKSQSYVAQKLRLLTLYWGTRQWIMSRDITEGHARQLLRLKGICAAITTEAPCYILDALGGNYRQAEWHEYFEVDLAYKVTEQDWTVAHLRDRVDILEERVVFAALRAEQRPENEDTQSARDWRAWRPDRAKIKDENLLAAARRRLGLLTESDENDEAKYSWVMAQADRDRPEADAEYQRLKADIAKNGVLVPVEYDEEGNVLDGHRRLRACAELGIDDWPSIIRGELTEDEKIEHILALNLGRRHERRDQVEA